MIDPYLSLYSIPVSTRIRLEASRNYLRSGGSNLLQSWPIAGLPSASSLARVKARSTRRSTRR